MVENQVLVELKCVDRFSNEHLAQCINYLKVSRLRLALLINFQKPRVEWRRVINGYRENGKAGGPRMDTYSHE